MVRCLQAWLVDAHNLGREVALRPFGQALSTSARPRTENSDRRPLESEPQGRKSSTAPLTIKRGTTRGTPYQPPPAPTLYKRLDNDSASGRDCRLCHRAQGSSIYWLIPLFDGTRQNLLNATEVTQTQRPLRRKKFLEVPGPFPSGRPSALITLTTRANVSSGDSDAPILPG